jgi:CIC family chloride channel protein
MAQSGRWRGTAMLGLSAITGVLAALVVAFVGWATQAIHKALFQLPAAERLSAEFELSSPWFALIPIAGGVALSLSIVLARRFRTRPPVDPIEANAIHGGRMSFRESVIVTAQTLLSTSFGASVGLEAGYTQLSSALASHIGNRLTLRRNEMRTLVGCGAAAAIAAASDAPFSGAFYGFELIIGTYSVGLLAPLITASLTAATFVARFLGAIQTPIVLSQFAPLTAVQVAPFLTLGILASGVAIASMLAVARTEQVLSAVRIPQPWRPIIGGAIIGSIALITPQILSTGHGALEIQLNSELSLCPCFLPLSSPRRRSRLVPGSVGDCSSPPCSSALCLASSMPESFSPPALLHISILNSRWSLVWPRLQAELLAVR